MLRDQIKAARRAGVPLVAVTTPDIAEAQREIVSALGDPPAPCVAWDIVRGMYGLNEAGATALAEIQGAEQLPNPVLALRQGADLPPGTTLCVANAQRYIQDAPVMQAAWNLRDRYKASRRTLILLGREMALPVELQTDVVEFDEPLPSEERLEEIAQKLIASVADRVDWSLTPEGIRETAQRLKGTSAFAAEQLLAMAVRKSSLDTDCLDTQAKRLIEQTPGLTFERGSETFDDIGGLTAAKTFGRRLFAGPRRPSVVVRVEELEKAMAGTRGDLSGTSSDALQVILSEMEDNQWSGMLAYGAPGAGKSLYSKTLANTHAAKAIRFDLNATKGSLVGQSEQRIRQALKVIKTLGGERVFFVASVNKLDGLPPELQRRFRCGVWYFDAPGEADRLAIWRLNQQRYKLESDDYPDSRDLTGADIRNICEMAFALGCDYQEALNYVVPLKTQSPGAITAARRDADGRYLDAHNGGVFRCSQDATSGREVQLR